MVKDFIGIDVGGTNLRGGVVRGAKIVRQASHPVGDARSPADIVAAIAALVHELTMGDRPPEAVGVGIPGIVDVASGTVIRSPHFPTWHEFPVQQQLSDALQLPVVIDNDANLIALGELTLGAGRELSHCVMMTLGTGIGGAIILDRALVHGNRGFAGEIGHIVIDRHGPPCPCGGRGHWEQYASASGFPNVVREVLGAATLLPDWLSIQTQATWPEQLAERAAAGDRLARRIWQRFGENVAIGVASVANVIGVEDCIIGGGLAGAWAWFAPAARAALPQWTYAAVAERLRLHRAALGDAAGIFGAAALAQRICI